jgi:hypothetical protein
MSAGERTTNNIYAKMSTLYEYAKSNYKALLLFALINFILPRPNNFTFLLLKETSVK